MSPRQADRMDEAALRRAVVAASRRLAARGLAVATEGNLSIRLSPDRLLVTPRGRRKDEVEADELLVVPLDLPDGAAEATAPSGARPSSDIRIHRAAYAARPDVAAVVHAHLPAALALTLAGQAPDPAVLPETALFLPRLPLVPFDAPGSETLAAAVGAALGSGEPRPGAVLLERHGAVAVGAGPDGLAALAQAVDRLELVEVLCRAWRDALLVRAAVVGAGPQAILRPPSPSPGAPARGRPRRKA